MLIVFWVQGENQLYFKGGKEGSEEGRACCVHLCAVNDIMPAVLGILVMVDYSIKYVTPLMCGERRTP